MLLIAITLSFSSPTNEKVFLADGFHTTEISDLFNSNSQSRTFNYSFYNRQFSRYDRVQISHNYPTDQIKIKTHSDFHDEFNTENQYTIFSQVVKQGTVDFSLTVELDELLLSKIKETGRSIPFILNVGVLHKGDPIPLPSNKPFVNSYFEKESLSFDGSNVESYGSSIYELLFKMENHRYVSSNLKFIGLDYSNIDKIAFHYENGEKAFFNADEIMNLKFEEVPRFVKVYSKTNDLFTMVHEVSSDSSGYNRTFINEKQGEYLFFRHFVGVDPHASKHSHSFNYIILLNSTTEDSIETRYLYPKIDLNPEAKIKAYISTIKAVDEYANAESFLQYDEQKNGFPLSYNTKGKNYLLITLIVEEFSIKINYLDLFVSKPIIKDQNEGNVIKNPSHIEFEEPNTEYNYKFSAQKDSRQILLVKEPLSLMGQGNIVFLNSNPSVTVSFLYSERSSEDISSESIQDQDFEYSSNSSLGKLNLNKKKILQGLNLFLIVDNDSISNNDFLISFMITKNSYNILNSKDNHNRNYRLLTVNINAGTQEFFYIKNDGHSGKYLIYFDKIEGDAAIQYKKVSKTSKDSFTELFNSENIQTTTKNYVEVLLSQDQDIIISLSSSITTTLGKILFSSYSYAEDENDIKRTIEYQPEEVMVFLLDDRELEVKVNINRAEKLKYTIREIYNIGRTTVKFNREAFPYVLDDTTQVVNDIRNSVQSIVFKADPNFSNEDPVKRLIILETAYPLNNLKERKLDETSNHISPDRVNQTKVIYVNSENSDNNKITFRAYNGNFSIFSYAIYLPSTFNRNEDIYFSEELLENTVSVNSANSKYHEIDFTQVTHSFYLIVRINHHIESNIPEEQNYYTVALHNSSTQRLRENFNKQYSSLNMKETESIKIIINDFGYQPYIVLSFYMPDQAGVCYLAFEDQKHQKKNLIFPSHETRQVLTLLTHNTGDIEAELFCDKTIYNPVFASYKNIDDRYHNHHESFKVRKSDFKLDIGYDKDRETLFLEFSDIEMMENWNKENVEYYTTYTRGRQFAFSEWNFFYRRSLSDSKTDKPIKLEGDRAFGVLLELYENYRIGLFAYDRLSGVVLAYDTISFVNLLTNPLGPEITDSSSESSESSEASESSLESSSSESIEDNATQYFISHEVISIKATPNNSVIKLITNIPSYKINFKTQSEGLINHVSIKDQDKEEVKHIAELDFRYATRYITDVFHFNKSNSKLNSDYYNNSINYTTSYIYIYLNEDKLVEENNAQPELIEVFLRDLSYNWNFERFTFTKKNTDTLEETLTRHSVLSSETVRFIVSIDEFKSKNLCSSSTTENLKETEPCNITDDNANFAGVISYPSSVKRIVGKIVSIDTFGEISEGDFPGLTTTRDSYHGYQGSLTFYKKNNEPNKCLLLTVEYSKTNDQDTSGFSLTLMNSPTKVNLIGEQEVSIKFKIDRTSPQVFQIDNPSKLAQFGELFLASADNLKAIIGYNNYSDHYNINSLPSQVNRKDIIDLNSKKLSKYSIREDYSASLYITVYSEEVFTTEKEIKLLVSNNDHYYLKTSSDYVLPLNLQPRKKNVFFLENSLNLAKSFGSLIETIEGNISGKFFVLNQEDQKKAFMRCFSCQQQNLQSFEFNELGFAEITIDVNGLVVIVLESNEHALGRLYFSKFIEDQQQEILLSGANSFVQTSTESNSQTNLKYVVGSTGFIKLNNKSSINIDLLNVLTDKLLRFEAKEVNANASIDISCNDSNENVFSNNGKADYLVNPTFCKIDSNETDGQTITFINSAYSIENTEFKTIEPQITNRVMQRVPGKSITKLIMIDSSEDTLNSVILEASSHGYFKSVSYYVFPIIAGENRIDRVFVSESCLDDHSVDISNDKRTSINLPRVNKSFWLVLRINYDYTVEEDGVDFFEITNRKLTVPKPKNKLPLTESSEEDLIHKHAVKGETTDSNKKGLSWLLIAGIAIGALLVITGATLVYKKYKKNSSESLNDEKNMRIADEGLISSDSINA